MVERWTFNPTVVGSTPTSGGVIFLTMKVRNNDKKKHNFEVEKIAPDVGVEPTTVGLKVQRSTTELTGLVECYAKPIEFRNGFDFDRR